jgi:integral membrane protein (TIGR00529 family)
LDIIKLVLIFSCIVTVIKLKKPLYVAIFAGILGTILLYGINPLEAIKLMSAGVFNLGTLNLVLAFYTITFLQRMMEKRAHLILAEKSLNNLFNSRRVNAMIAPFIIGLLPSPSAVLIASPIVDNAGGDYISREEKTFITSYFRHISEAFLPTYSTILLALNLSGVDMTTFVIAMLPMGVVLFLLGYFIYVRKIPKNTGLKKSNDKGEDVKNLIISLWPIAFTIVIILVFKIPVHYAVFPIIILSFALNKFTFEEIKPMFRSAIESKLILTTIVIMMFKEILTFTGVIQRLPGHFSALPIPPVFIFVLIFFFGTLVAGSQGMIAIALPLAFATMPNGGLALMILIMCTTYIASQVSPTHICLGIIVEHYGISFIDLVKKTIPIALIFILICSLYSYLLYLLL